MFDRLRKPKWQHTDPRQRKAALESASLPADVLATIAREDSDADVRRSAILRIDDPALLAALMQAGLDSIEQELVIQRQCALLATPLDAPPALDERLAIIDRMNSADLCGCLARQARAIEIRSAALERVTDTQLLCAVAVDDPVASVRRVALDRIDDPEGWEIVSRNARSRDKQLSRIAREKLEAFRQAQSDRETAGRLCAEMDELLAADSLSIGSQAIFQRLCDQWQNISTQPAPELAERFEQLRQQVVPRIERFETQVGKRRAVCAQLEALLEQLQAGTPGGPDQAKQLAASMQEIGDRWQATDPAQNSDNPVSERYAVLEAQVRQAMQRLERDSQRMAELHELVGRAEALLQASDRVNQNEISKLQQRWNDLAKPESAQLMQSLQNRFDTALRRVRDSMKQQLDRRKTALEEAEKLLPELQQALTQGELERALSLRDRIRHRLKTAKGVEKKRHQALQDKLNQTRARLEELRQWRQWGSGHAREHLLTETQALIGSSLSPDEIAARVRSARKAWQRIDKAEGPADDALWQRFDQACTSAYEPFQQQRKQQKQALEQHLAQKKALCAELIAFEHNTDWGHVDWRETDHYIHKARERWRRIGPVTRKAGRSAEKEFHAVLELLEGHLAPERNRELRRRRALIARIEELTGATDLRAAAREVKDAQDQWKPTVPLPRKEEQALWKQFRSACDAVFDRIRQERASADEQRQANLRRKQAICDELESMLDQPDTAMRAIQKQFAAAAEAWSEIRNIPRKHERALNERYQAINKRLADRQRQARKSATEARVQAIRARSDLCARLEHEVLDQTMDEAARQALLDQCNQSWQALPQLDAEHATPLQARYELAARALQGDVAAQADLGAALEQNLLHRRQLCLQLEVAAGVDSPPEYAAERMSYQVSLLADSLQHKLAEHPSREDKMTALAIDWLLAGPVSQAQRRELADRFEHALNGGQ